VPSSFRDRLQDEVPTWVDEGLVTRDQAEAILERYGAAPSDDKGGVRALLYGTAAVLVGAAALALVFVGLDPAEPAPVLTGVGLALAVAGGGLHLAGRGLGRIADAVLGASLVPLAAAPLEGELALASAAVLAVPVAYLALRRSNRFVPALAVVAFTVAAGATAYDLEGWVVTTDEAAAAIWVAVQTALLAAVVAADQVRGEVSPAPGALAVGGAAVSTVLYLEDGVGLSSIGIELTLGTALLAVMGAAILLQHRGAAVGAAVGLCVDAIVFAFDVDEIFGTVLLLVLGGTVIWRAETLRGWLASG
jgi:uncharacterized membrane protein